MNAVYSVLLIGLSLAAALVLVRLVRGPSIADRVVATDTLLLVLVSALAVRTAQTRDPRLVVLIVVVSLIGFVATTAAARFLERAPYPPTVGARAPAEPSATDRRGDER